MVAKRRIVSIKIVIKVRHSRGEDDSVARGQVVRGLREMD